MCQPIGSLLLPDTDSLVCDTVVVRMFLGLMVLGRGWNEFNRIDPRLIIEYY